MVVLAAGGTIAPGALAAQAAETTRGDTTRASAGPLFSARDAFYAGGFVLATAAMLPFDQRIARESQRANTQANRSLRHLATDFRLAGNPGTLVIGVGTYAIGRVGHYERVADIGLHGTEAVVLAEGINFLIKGVAGRARPYVSNDTDSKDVAFGRGFRKGEDYQSFPSGHAVAGFAAAAAVTSEAARLWPRSTWLVGPVMYGGATLVGLSRLYNDKHWASDVVMAAGIGVLTGTKVVRYNHSGSRNRIDRWLLSASIVPTREGGVAVGWSIEP